MTLLHERYASAKDFLAELAEFHGSNRAYIVNPARSLVMARCPCSAYLPKRYEPWEIKKYGKTGERHWSETYRIMLWKAPREGPWPPWDYSIFCTCSEEFIIAPLVRMQRDRLERQMRELEATALALEEGQPAFVN